MLYKFLFLFFILYKKYMCQLIIFTNGFFYIIIYKDLGTSKFIFL